MAALVKIVRAGEHAPDRRADAQYPEEVARHQFTRDELRAASERCAHGIAMRAEHAVEDLILVADILVHRIRQLVAAVVSAVVPPAPGQHHQLLGIFHRQTPQDELMDQGEDGGVGADAECKR